MFELLVTTPQYQTAIFDGFTELLKIVEVKEKELKNMGYKYNGDKSAYIDPLDGYWFTFQIVPENYAPVRDHKELYG